METKQKFMAVFSLRMAGYLMMHGFVLMDLRDHIDGSGKKVFYFIYVILTFINKLFYFLILLLSNIAKKVDNRMLFYK